MTRTRSQRRRGGGFTLLELLISLGVLAFMMVIAWGTIRSTVTAKKHFEQVQERYRGVRTALARIEKDISMAYLSSNESTLNAERRTFFIGESSMSYDTLRFTTFAHQRLYSDANESDQSIVSYYTAPDPDDARLTVLYRKESHRLANPGERYDTPAGDADILFSGISKFKVKYWNTQDRDWDETWSTIAADGQANRLPDRVKISLSFEDERGKEVTFVTQTKLPLQEVLSNVLSARRRRGKHFTQQGMALIFVAFVTAFIGVITAEFAYNTEIDYASAANARDDMRAYYLARSGMNLSRLVIKVQKDVFDKYRKYLGDVQLADYLPLLTGAFGGSKEDVEAFATAVGGIDTGGIKGLGIPEGEFDVAVTTDDGKININCANSSPSTQKQLELMLVAMVMPGAYDKIFEERDGDGQFTDRPTFVKALMDFADRDSAGYGANGTAEDYGYESLGDPYKAHDDYLDSVDELQLVRGMDERRWALFGPAFTVYGGCKINVSAANDLNVIVAVIYQSAKNPDDPVLRDPQLLWALAGRVAQARGMGIMFEKLPDFAEFVKDPDAALGDLAGGTDGTSGGQQNQGTVLPNGKKLQGVELDQAKLSQIAKVGGRRTYRVIATAKIGRVEKKIVGVFDSEFQNQNARDPAYAKGWWVYWREE